MESPAGPGSRPLAAYLCVSVVLVALCAILPTWAASMGASDLFMSLAGGRDVMDGKIGQPDDWSFTTGGRVWINQNWLSHLLMFLTWRVGGQTGLLVLKAVLLVAMAAFLSLLSRRRGCTWPAAVLLAGGLTLSCCQFAELRANLVTLVMVPMLMWLLYRSIDNRHRIWWTLPVMLAWANLHGGFVFGLGMIGLWAICVSAWDWYRRGRSSLRENWPLWACAASCVAVAAVSPFGTQNLTHPLVIASSASWRRVREWRPLLAPSRLPVPWPFFIVLGLTASLAIARLGAFLVGGRSRGQGPAAASVAAAPSVFGALLTLIAVAMAFHSRRFVPLAIVVSAEPLASLLSWLTARFGRKVLLALSICILAPVIGLTCHDVVVYWPDNPVHRGTSIFDRMHGLPESFPVSAAQFLADNHIRGNAFCDWEAEGYLHWVCPDVRVFIGGRAQQIYSEDTFETYTRLNGPRIAPDLLRQNHVQMVVLCIRSDTMARVSKLLLSGEWPCIYSDGSVIILVDAQECHPLVQQALDGKLKYSFNPVRALSRALCLATTLQPGDPAEMLAAVEEANAAAPTPLGYFVLRSLGRSPSLRPSIIQRLEAESSRLAQLPITGANHLMILSSRHEIQLALAGLYRDAGRTSAATNAQAQAGALAQQIAALGEAWR